MTNDLFFDTDCLSAFLWINDMNILHELYGGKIVLPEPVYQELSNPCIPHIKQRADFLIENKDAFVKTIEVGTDEYRLYTSLIRGEMGKKSIGRGEAGGIALAKVYHGVLASNNYKDIAPYIEKYGLKHIDTGQILEEALEKGLITETEGNSIWSRMLAKKRKLPAGTFSEYLSNRR
ncbi:MAG: hypothetical protein IKU83_05060 [Lachnospiraceae bacterium]|nr:hypothetical protein [Lachnospiraceae bacterium]